MEPIKLHTKKLGALGASVYYLFFIVGAAVIGFVFLDDPRHFHPAIRWLILAVSVPMFVIPFLLCIAQAFSPEPLLILRDEGIVDNSYQTGAGLIPWENIERIYIGRKPTHIGMSGQARMQLVVCIVPKDVPGFLQKQPPFRREIYQWNKMILGTPIAIPVSYLPVPLEKFQEMLQSTRKGVELTA